MAESLAASKYVNGIYIPAGLIVVGTAIVKRDFTLYAAILAVLLAALKFYRMREQLFTRLGLSTARACLAQKC